MARIGEGSASRNGNVTVAPSPVTTVYDRPTERVLFDPRRDANPFFHLFESLWMLAGRNDALWLDQFVKDFSSRYAEPGGIMHGAYGHRWRGHFDVDQISAVVHRLQRDNFDRRVVISMWDPMHDLITPDDVDPETGRATWLDEPEPRDLPCNTHIYPRVRTWWHAPDDPEMVLDITVCCRSNDIIWGAYGANAVHFSVLQEYMAAALGVGVGKMYQVSNNWHVYDQVRDKMFAGWEPEDRLTTDYYILTTGSGQSRVHPMRMVSVPHLFLRDCEYFTGREWEGYIYGNNWFHAVAVPMRRAHRAWREGDYSLAIRTARDIEASDWRHACLEWLTRRANKNG